MAQANHNVAMVSGRVRAVRTVETKMNGTMFEHVMDLPVLDAYTAGGVVAVLCKQRRGAVGEELQIPVRLSGSSRQYLDKSGATQTTYETRLREIL